MRNYIWVSGVALIIKNLDLVFSSLKINTIIRDSFMPIRETERESLCMIINQFMRENG